MTRNQNGSVIAVTQSKLLRRLRQAAPSLLMVGLAVILPLASPVLLSAQAPRGAACDSQIGDVVFTGLPQGGAPSDLLAFKTSSGRNAAGLIVPGTYWLCKPVDQNSLGLMLASIKATQITSIQVEVMDPNPTSTSLVFDLKNAIVSSVAVVAKLDGLAEEIEVVSCDVTITINHPDGDPDTVMQHCASPGP